MFRFFSSLFGAPFGGALLAVFVAWQFLARRLPFSFGIQPMEFPPNCSPFLSADFFQRHRSLRFWCPGDDFSLPSSVCWIFSFVSGCCFSSFLSSSATPSYSLSQTTYSNGF
ncbi:uncharacterized protein BYT42DRAFT_561988 [Radiomyces spectabilis]|uniref:uncharacterized protein n=1 Tax=Radiomyces spectabilis TaxID=64574 RepID=UPI00221F210E|nr:uncharacterized protein BYT42DRAFT_561988 [Radiomyces spectabilis]KAI8384281.1 hypothetical protein BYT42DRAFT_561988 [Radiomyces spectabilis]